MSEDASRFFFAHTDMSEDNRGGSRHTGMRENFPL